MASIGSDDGDVGFQIAPMVDVVFVLMLFFMASAGSQQVETELGINLPGNAPSGNPTSQAVVTPIRIDIAADGQVLMNDESVGTPLDKNLPELRAKLKEMIEQFGDKDPVIIRPAIDARHERVMDVLNAAAAAKVKNLTFS
jgi:biopolymer transport protein ExbD